MRRTQWRMPPAHFSECDANCKLKAVGCGQQTQMVCVPSTNQAGGCTGSFGRPVTELAPLTEASECASRAAKKRSLAHASFASASVPYADSGDRLIASPLALVARLRVWIVQMRGLPDSGSFVLRDGWVFKRCSLANFLCVNLCQRRPHIGAAPLDSLEYVVL